jgi:hypothetical protein
MVFPLVRPGVFSAASFDAGRLAEILTVNAWPAASEVRNALGFALGLWYTACTCHRAEGRRPAS